MLVLESSSVAYLKDWAATYLNTNIHIGIVMPLKEKKEINPMDLPVVGRVDLPLYGHMQGKMTAGSVKLYY